MATIKTDLKPGDIVELIKQGRYTQRYIRNAATKKHNIKIPKDKVLILMTSSPAYKEWKKSLSSDRFVTRSCIEGLASTGEHVEVACNAIKIYKKKERSK